MRPKTVPSTAFTFVEKQSCIYFFGTEALVSGLHVRERHPQGVQLGAAGQQLGLQLVLLGLDPLGLRLEAGQLHCRPTQARPVRNTTQAVTW